MITSLSREQPQCEQITPHTCISYLPTAGWELTAVLCVHLEKLCCQVPGSEAQRETVPLQMWSWTQLLEQSAPESLQMLLLALLYCICQGHPRKQYAGIELMKLAARHKGLTVHLERLIYAKTLSVVTYWEKKVKHCEMGSDNCISLRMCLAGGRYLLHEVRDHDTVILTESMDVVINLTN